MMNNIKIEEKKEVIEVLIKEGNISQEMYQKALHETKRTGLNIVQALDHLEFISEEVVAEKEATIIQVPYVNLKYFKIDKELLKSIPIQTVREFKILPLFKVFDTILVAMTNPREVTSMDKIRHLNQDYLFEPVLVSESAMDQALSTIEETDNSFQDILTSFDEKKHAIESNDVESLIKIADAPPMIKLVNHVIRQAIKDSASDIHIEPCKDDFRIRYRVNGTLHEVITFPKPLQNAFISRIKILSTMDIAENRKPQDGRFKIDIDEKSFDLRVSTFPTIFGENIVLRILDKASVLLGLKNVGFQGEDLEQFKQLIRQPNGIILVTGPTGSGKTTTLYSALGDINSMEKNIITLEDPIEYQLPIIRQTQINPQVGLTFASGLRNILRQDPDVIMLGEIRDLETAEVAIHAALTGHLVLSTLHTNDAPSAIIRLVNMGIETFLISSSLSGVIAQRLLRLICTNCKEKITPPPEALASLGLPEDIVLYAGKGCDECKQTGYIGRTAIFEILIINEKIRELILAKERRVAIIRAEACASSKSFKTLREQGIEYIKKGLTTLDEVLLITKE